MCGCSVDEHVPISWIIQVNVLKVFHYFPAGIVKHALITRLYKIKIKNTMLLVVPAAFNVRN